MKRKPHSRRKRTSTKSVLRLPDLEHSKTAVLNSLTSLDAQRGYRHAIDEFVDWYCSEPRLAFNRIVVLRYRSHLESRQLAPGTVNLRLGAVRRPCHRRPACAPTVGTGLILRRLTRGPRTTFRRFCQDHGEGGSNLSKPDSRHYFRLADHQSTIAPSLQRVSSVL
jgi:hypothetical protein